MSNPIEIYLKHPKYPITLLKNKSLRYTFSGKNETKRLMFVDNLEKEVIDGTDLSIDLRRNYANKVLDLAVKHNLFFFESSIFDKPAMEILFNKGKHKIIETFKENIIQSLISKDSDDLTREDYLILISLIGKDNNRLELTRLMYMKYRDLQNKDDITLYEAEFLIKYTLYISGSTIKSYISNLNYYDNSFNEPIHFYFDEEERVLVFNERLIRKLTKQKNKDISTSQFLVLKALEVSFFEKEVNDLYNGVVNYRTIEIAITKLLHKYIEDYRDEAFLGQRKISKIRTILFEEDSLPTNKVSSVSEMSTNASSFSHLQEDDIKALDEIIYYYPNELDNYGILKHFYKQDGTRKESIDIEPDDVYLSYILNLFERTKKKPHIISKKSETFN